MNNTQCEQLFTDLTPAQAEAITAAGTDTITPVPTGGSIALARYGSATAGFKRVGPGLFNGVVFVKDQFADGFPVYAKFQGLATDNTILTTSRELLDARGAAGAGTNHVNVWAGFNKNIKQLRVVIFRKNPGRDLFTAGNWSAL